ncbi:hypothetical protein Tco_0368745 [Tanacetum coccineum]
MQLVERTGNGISLGGNLLSVLARRNTTLLNRFTVSGELGTGESGLSRSRALTIILSIQQHREYTTGGGKALLELLGRDKTRAISVIIEDTWEGEGLPTGFYNNGMVTIKPVPVSQAGKPPLSLELVTTWEDLVEKFVQKFYQLSDDNEEMEADEGDDPDDIAKIFKIKGILFDNDTPLCKAFNDFNYLLKIDTNLFTFDIQGIKTYEGHELNNNMAGDLEEPWNYGTDNSSNIKENQEHHDPSTCCVRRFEMIKYSFNADDEYVAIKEHECSDHSKTNIDACQAYRKLFRIMDEGWLVTKACDE